MENFNLAKNGLRIHEKQFNNKLEFMRSQNLKIKEQLRNLSSAIESNLYQNKTPNNEIQKDYYSIEEFNTLQSQIKKYKDLIHETNTKMETLYNSKRIKALENENLIKTEKLEKLKIENSTLSKIRKNINKGIPNSKELKIIEDKCRRLKSELKYSKESLKLTETNLKTQNKEIIELDNTNSKIKECIELRNKNKNLQNEDGSLDELTEKIKLLELQIGMEDKLFKENINSQNLVISNHNEDLTKFRLRIKGKEQKIKIEEMKIKELIKLKRNEEKKNFDINLKSNETPHKNEYKNMEYGRNNNNNNRAIIFTNSRKKRPFDIKFSNNIKNSPQLATNSYKNIYYDKSKENKPLVRGIEYFMNNMDSPSTNFTERKENNQHQFINHIQNLRDDIEYTLKKNDDYNKNNLYHMLKSNDDSKGYSTNINHNYKQDEEGEELEQIEEVMKILKDTHIKDNDTNDLESLNRRKPFEIIFSK